MPRTCLALALSLLTPACREKPPWPEGPPRTPTEERAERVWQERCAECHGPAGRGDGPRAATLTVKPRDLTDPGWQAEDPDDHLELVIVLGGAAAGYSAEMPPNPDLGAEPEVARALIRRIRGLYIEMVFPQCVFSRDV